MTASAHSLPPYPNTPVVDMGIAVLTLVVNLFLPGIGTIIAGAVGGKPTIGRGIAQLLLSLIFVGWVWALVTSIQVLMNASWNDKRAAHPA